MQEQKQPAPCEAAAAAAGPAPTTQTNQKRIGEHGVAKKDDMWHEVVITGFSNDVWHVQEILKDGGGKEWHTKDFYQAKDAGVDTRWVQAQLEASGKKLTDLGAGRRNDCWYLSAEASLRERGKTQGNPEEFRKKLADYGREHVLPSYDETNPDRVHVLETLARIETGDMAESAELKWTANLTSVVIFLSSRRYDLSVAAAGTSPAMWSVIVPRAQETHLNVTSSACMAQMNGHFVYLHSDGNHHYEAYLDSLPQKSAAAPTAQGEKPDSSRAVEDGPEQPRQPTTDVASKAGNTDQQQGPAPLNDQEQSSPDRSALIADGVRRDLPYWSSQQNSRAEQIVKDGLAGCDEDLYVARHQSGRCQAAVWHFCRRWYSDDWNTKNKGQEGRMHCLVKP